MSSARKRLFNTIDGIIEDATASLVATNSQISRVAGLNVVVHSNINTIKAEQVTILTGGGSGHEPAHAGYIGYRMLSGAILGNVFASPSVSSIIAAIRIAAGPRGVLLVVKNYTGDRLNFGMAAEIAKKEGIATMMVVVDDDCALSKEKGITGGRGIAGTIFVHKIAGAVAASGASLSEVHAAAVNAVHRIKSLGVALTTCTVPGSTKPSERLAKGGADGVFEIGMGIHGEPGRELATLPDDGTSAQSVAQILTSGVISAHSSSSNNSSGSNSNSSGSNNGISSTSGKRLAVMINNLGTMSEIEMGVISGEVMKCFKSEGYDVVRLYVGTFMTALDMSGLSLSIFSIDNTSGATACDDSVLNNIDICALLDAPTTADAWKPSSIHERYRQQASVPPVIQYKVPVPSPITPATATKGTAYQCTPAIFDLIAVACMTLIRLEPTLTEYDTFCGDGDCGLTMKKGALQILTDLRPWIALAIKDNIEFHQHYDAHAGTTITTYLNVKKEEDEESVTAAALTADALCQLLAAAISKSMGGTSGALLELCFTAMSAYFATTPPAVDGAAAGAAGSGVMQGSCWAKAWEVGTEAIQTYGGAKQGMRTMLDALIPAVGAMKDHITPAPYGSDVSVDFSVEQFKKVAANTARAAQAGAQATATMDSQAGRSNYISAEAMKGYPDPGAHAVAEVISDVTKRVLTYESPHTLW